MKVDPQQLLDNGYIILREVIPPGQLDELRECFETLVERQKDHLGGGTRTRRSTGRLLGNCRATTRVFFDGVADESNC